MSEQAKPLEIAFMGWNEHLTAIAFDDFARDNREQVAYKKGDRLILHDGTRITAFSPGLVRYFFDGYRFDQMILADDSRETIRIERRTEIEIIRNSMYSSCVPEEYQILFYNMDAPEPENKSESTLERLSRAFAEIGLSTEEAADAFRQVGKAIEEIHKGGQNGETF